MPYYHNDCRGKIKWYPPLPISPRCERCGKRWPWWVIYGPSLEDMYYDASRIGGRMPRMSAPTRGSTSYAKWADGIPGLALLASRLPSWPRKWRIVSFLAAVLLLSGAFYGLSLVSWWAVALVATAIFISPPLIIMWRKP